MPICFMDEDAIEDEGLIQMGNICFGTLDENFESSLHRWSREEYESSWVEAASAVWRGENAAFITEFSLPQDNNRLWWWPLYRDGDVVHIQMHLLIFDHLDKPFDPSQPFASLRPRITHNEDGQLLSEWTVGIEEFRPFVVSCRGDN
jgi:hypothetical protein